MRSVAAIFVFACVGITTLLAQGEIDDQEKVFFRNEKTFAAILSTNGYGGNFRYAKRINARRKTTYEIGFNYIKHEKEYKVSYSSSQGLGGRFVFGKTNNLFALRFGVGSQKEIFRKEDKGSISIRYFYNFGPSIGFEKPIYYDVIVSEQNPEGKPVQVRKTMKFESHIIAVEQKAPFWYGIEETKIVPGVYAKFGFTFEFGKSDKIFNALEVGVVIDTYIRTIPIMANEFNHFIFPAGYVCYRFGKVINSQFSGRKQNKVDDILSN